MHINRLSGLPTLEHATYNCPWEKQSIFRSIPHYSNDCPWALLMVIANRTFPVSPSSFIYPPVPPASPLLLFPCVPVVICVTVSQSVISLWVSRSSFIFPVSRCPGRHLCSGVPVCNFSLSVLVVIYIPCVPVVICVPVLCWWWLLIEHSLCPGHFLFECPGRHLYSLCLSVPVVICVPMSRSVISPVDKYDVSRHTNMTSLDTQTHRQLIYIYI